jgi:hypothetical protein
VPGIVKRRARLTSRTTGQSPASSEATRSWLPARAIPEKTDSNSTSPRKPRPPVARDRRDRRGQRPRCPRGPPAAHTLRLGSGDAAYGHELSLTTFPVQAGLGRVVNLKKEGDFVIVPPSRPVRSRVPAFPCRPPRPMASVPVAPTISCLALMVGRWE